MRIVPVAACGLFIIACCLPALEFNKEHARDVTMGLNVLVVGWSGIFAGVTGWYANPVWLFAIIMSFVGNNKLAAAGSLLALLIGLTTCSTIGKLLPADEGGVTHMTLVKLLPGAYVWLLSLSVPMLGLLIRK
jgi:hypothetical protein